MSQDLTESYKKLDALKQLECDTNIVYILEILNKWNKNADNKQLKKVITSLLQEYKQKFIKYENKHFTGNRRGDTKQRRS
jgi:uncharacterized protein YbaP (TraB family)